MADIKGVTPPFIDEIAGLAGFIYELRGGLSVSSVFARVKRQVRQV